MATLQTRLAKIGRRKGDEKNEFLKEAKRKLLESITQESDTDEA